MSLLEDKTDGSPDRNSQRLSFRCKVKFGTGRRLEHIALVTDFSETGICIKTAFVFEAGTKLNMLLESNGKKYQAEGEVMWSKKVPPGLSSVVKCGMGVKFLSVDEEFISLHTDKAKNRR